MKTVKRGELPIGKPVRLANDCSWTAFRPTVELTSMGAYKNICACGCTAWARSCSLEATLLGEKIEK